ncbi:tape measure protein [Lacunimicrobium album]
MAYGFTAREVGRELKMLGELSAASQVPLRQIITAYGQVRGATKLTGNEARQFTEAGIQIWPALAEKMGLSVAKVQELVSAGKVGFPVVQEALREMTEEGGRFHGQLEAQAKAFKGMQSTLGGSMQELAVTIGGPFLGAGTLALRWMNNMTSVANDLASVGLAPLQAYLDRMSSGFGMVTTVFEKIYAVAKNTVSGLMSFREEAASLAADIGAVIAQTDAGAAAMSLFGTASKGASNMLAFIGTTIDNIDDGFRELFGLLGDGARLALGIQLKPLQTAVEDAVSSIPPGVESAGKEIEALQAKLDKLRMSPVDLFKSQNPGATADQIAEHMRLNQEIDATEQAQRRLNAAQSAAENAKNQVRDMAIEYQVLTGRMTEYEAVSRRAMEAGVSPERAEQLAHMTRYIDEQRKKLEDQKKATDSLRQAEESRISGLKTAAEQLKESLKNPFQKLLDDLGQLRELMEGGFISKQQYNQAIQQKYEGVGDNGQKDVSQAQPGALRQGSNESYSAVLAAMRGDGIKKMSPAEKKQTDLLTECREFLRELAEKEGIELKEVG